MLVGSDAPAHVIGFTIELTLMLLGEVALVLRHVFFLIILETLFSTFETARLSGSELTVLDAIGNAILLKGFATVDLVDARMTRINLTRTSAGDVLGLSRG